MRRRLYGSPLLKGIRRAKRTAPSPVAVLLAVALIVTPAWISSALLYGRFSIGRLPPLVEEAVFYGFMFGLALGLLFVWVRSYERRDFESLLGSTVRPLSKALRGFFVGVALAAGTVAVLAGAGAVSFEASLESPTGLTALGGVLAGAVLLWAFPAAVEELIARGWLLQSLSARHGVVGAVAISSLAFALWHWILDPSMGPLPPMNLVLAGSFWCLYALREGSLVGVCAAHAAYNWAETNLFGFDFYGNEPTGGSLINLKETGPTVLTGGGVGLNTTGGLAFSFVQLLAIVVLLVLIRRSA